MLPIQHQSIRPQTTAHLAQTMTLLGMTSDELNQKIEAELAQNPALELLDERRCPNCGRPLRDSGPCSICSRPAGSSADEPIVFVSTREDFPTHTNQRTTAQPDFPEDSLAASVDDLPTFILRQISAELPVEDRSIAAHILTALDEDGLLPIPLMEISRYHYVPISRVEEVKRTIQHAEPYGTGSGSPTEALLVQLEILGETCPVPTLAERAIREGMSLLSRHRYPELAKLLGISSKKAEEIARFIGDNLNPYPARAHWGDIRQGQDENPQVYHHPDIIIRKLDERDESPLVVEIVIPIRGTLRINPLFRQSIKDAPEDSIYKWKRDLEQANLLIKCIQQRNNTIQRLMIFLTRFQRKFILAGEKFLHPITRASIADELGVHESTISRAVSGKKVELPNKKIIPLEMFFDRSLSTRAVLRTLIDNEKTALTDTQLVKLLDQHGHKIARRTVAKYRAMEGILPAHLRRNLSHS